MTSAKMSPLLDHKNDEGQSEEGNVLEVKAKEHHDKATLYIKPKIMRWKKRYGKAADEYCKAAQYHHQSGNSDEAQQDLLLALECFEKKRNWFPAAKTLEQIILLSSRKSLGKDDELLMV